MTNSDIQSKNKTKTNSVAKNTVAMSIATLSSRITGLFRTWFMAFALGNTLITSAYSVANNMPNVIFDLVAGGILGAAFIPIFMLEKERGGKQGGNDFCVNVLNITILIMGVLSIIAVFFAPQIIWTQTFTVDNTSLVTEKSIMFFRVFAFQILFYGISAVLTGILNGERVYFMPAFAPAINNIVVILTFIAYSIMSSLEINEDLCLIVLAIGTTLGVAIQAIMQIPAIIKTGFKWRPYINSKDPALFEALKIAIPTVLFVIGTLVAFSCRNAFSIKAMENGPSTLLYAWIWYQLPYGVIAVSLSRTMFTEMSTSFAQNNMERLRTEVESGLSSTCVLIIPMAVLMISFSNSLLNLFRAGQFNVTDVSVVSTFLQYWLVSLPFYSVVMYMYNIFAAIRKFYLFAITSLICVFLQCWMYYVFCNDYANIDGIPLADFIFYALCTVVLTIILKKQIGKFRVRVILWKALRVTIASILGCLIGNLFSKLIPLTSFFAEKNILISMLELCLWGGISIILILIFCRLFRVPEVTKILDKVTGFIKNKILFRIG